MILQFRFHEPHDFRGFEYEDVVRLALSRPPNCYPLNGLL